MYYYYDVFTGLYGAPRVFDLFEQGTLSGRSHEIFDMHGNLRWENIIESTDDESWEIIPKVWENGYQRG